MSDVDGMADQDPEGSAVALAMPTRRAWVVPQADRRLSRAIDRWPRHYVFGGSAGAALIFLLGGLGSGVNPGTVMMVSATVGLLWVVLTGSVVVGLGILFDLLIRLAGGNLPRRRLKDLFLLRVQNERPSHWRPGFIWRLQAMCAVLAFVTAAGAATFSSWLALPLFVMGGFSALQASIERKASVEICDEGVQVNSGWRAPRLIPWDDLVVLERPVRLAPVMADGQLNTVTILTSLSREVSYQLCSAQQGAEELRREILARIPRERHLHPFLETGS